MPPAPAYCDLKRGKEELLSGPIVEHHQKKNNQAIPLETEFQTCNCIS